MFGIDRELEQRYLRADADATEIEVLTKVIEECGELVGEISGVICEMSGSQVKTWKGKDKHYRQEMLHEFMDVARMMEVWIRMFATEEEVVEMMSTNRMKIEKFVEKKEAAEK